MMTTTVARRYYFRAQHSVPIAGYDHPHEHDYTVEFEFQSSSADLFDTALIDAWWSKLVPLDGANLNRFFGDTTVEGLAQWFVEAVREEFAGRVVSVMVREDRDRQARAA